MKYKPVKRNPIAKDLLSPKYRARVVSSKKVYSRKNKKETREEVLRWKHMKYEYTVGLL